MATYQRGDLVRYQGSHTSKHGVYEVVGYCPCVHCPPGTRWRIAAVDVTLICVRPGSIARLPSMVPCEDCGRTFRIRTVPWCQACMDAWIAANA
jgi:hypothetical protein